MVKNIMDNIDIDEIYRLDVNFQIEERNLDSIIGRKAHILLLDNKELIRMIVSRYKEFFS